VFFSIALNNAIRLTDPKSKFLPACRSYFQVEKSVLAGNGTVTPPCLIKEIGEVNARHWDCDWANWIGLDWIGLDWIVFSIFLGIEAF